MTELTEINYFDKDLFLKGLLAVYATTETEVKDLLQTLPSLVNSIIAFSEASIHGISSNILYNKLIYVRVNTGEPYFYHGSNLETAAFYGAMYAFNWSLLNKNSPVSLEDFLKEFL